MEPNPAQPHYLNGPQDWVEHKSEIVELYNRKELKDVMLYMEQHYNVRAT